MILPAAACGDIVGQTITAAVPLSDGLRQALEAFNLGN